MTSRFLRFVPAFLVASSLVFTASQARAEEPERELTPKSHFMSCKLYLTQKVFDKAEEQGRLAVKGDSTQADYHGYWATALASLARERLGNTASISDTSARLDSVRAVAGLYDNARREFETAMRLNPKEPDYGTNRMHFWAELYALADSRMKANPPDYGEALELYKLTTVLDPKEPAGVFWVGYTLAQLNRPLEGVKTVMLARQMADQRIAELGDCSQLKGKAKVECSKAMKSLLIIQQNVESFTKSKNVEIGRSELEAAGAESDAAAKRGRLESAISYLNKGLEQDPSLENVRFDIADAQFKLGTSYEGNDSSMAHKYYREAAGTFLTIADNDSSAQDSKKDALFNANMALYQASEWNRVLPLLKRYVDIDAHDQDIWRRIAKVNAELDKRPEAISSLMMSNALGDGGEDVPVEESISTVKNLYAGSDAARSLSELGNPEQVRAFRDNENSRVITTWIWWTKGQVRHFVDGKQVGTLSFAGQAA